ncbi:NADP-dependent oxidoreductase [Fodinibius saliphilus]|uniref:NADP-dependent oxidoreductase n=1 Tax=Fodinibius saliphilus TaxID=1920650 RepID=UPI0011081F48|nr:NADP-dependent oxidoreductase [Fodinibius saliphilus]
MNKVIKLANRPTGKPVSSDFKIEEIKKPSPSDGEMLLKPKFVSVDPYLRGRMRDVESYVDPFKLNKAISSPIVAEVISSENTSFEKGDYVTAELEWKKYQLSNGNGLRKINPDLAPLSAHLGVLGLTGIAAFIGLTEIGVPKEEETLVVSGAAGAVGSVVGQIGKIKGCHVVGIAGSDEKVELLKSKFGFDAAINYKTTENMSNAISQAAESGVDVYFDNVAGDISDGVYQNMNNFGRIINCGAIALYNATSVPTGPRLEPMMVQKRLSMQGFIVSDYQEKFPEAVKQLAKWLKKGELEYAETIVEGFDNIPNAFLGLFEGDNKGKMIVKI